MITDMTRSLEMVKIDILDDYVWTPEWFREVSDIYRSTGGYRNPPRRLMGLLGPNGEEEGRPKGSRVPPPPHSKLDKEGGGAPFSFPPLSPSLSSPTPTWKGGVLLPVGVGLLMGRA